jgi:hypothetical protein
MKQDAFTMNEEELKFFLKILSREHMSAKEKLETSKRYFEFVDAIAQRAGKAYVEIQEERNAEMEESGE